VNVSPEALEDLSERLVGEEEGPSNPHVYPDSRGFWTISRGCLVDKRVPDCEGLCAEARAVQDAYDLGKAAALAATLPGFDHLSPIRIAVATSMCYQLGALKDWDDFRTALVAGDYNECATQMLLDDPGTPKQRPSAWHKETPRRCERAAYMMKSGQWLAHGDPIPSTEV
jgi:GH24 family phage-related lysozyme (muramidase)